MKRTILAVSAAMFLIVCILSLPHHTTAQTPYSQPVRVTNAGVSQAVPVLPQGTTPVSGTVSVGNTVPVTGSVAVTNTATNPIPVLPRLGGTPYDRSGYCSINGGTNYCSIQITPDNPDPGTWVIESIGCSGSAPPGDSVLAELSYEDHYSGNSRTLDFSLPRAATQGGSDFYATNQLLRAYTIGGRMHVGLSRYTASGPDVGSSSGTFSCVVSGLMY